MYPITATNSNLADWIYKLTYKTRRSWQITVCSMHSGGLNFNLGIRYLRTETLPTPFNPHVTTQLPTAKSFRARKFKVGHEDRRRQSGAYYMDKLILDLFRRLVGARGVFSLVVCVSKYKSFGVLKVHFDKGSRWSARRSQWYKNFTSQWHKKTNYELVI